MSVESTIDLQADTYQQLFSQHENTRREHQLRILPAIEQLNNEVNHSTTEDKRAYDNAKETFRKKYNLFERMFTGASSRYKHSSVLPYEYVYRRRQDLSAKVTNLLNETILETTPMEVRSHWNGSIAVVYNPITGRAEWRENWHGGIHGVFNPATRTIEWRDEFRTGVYGVFNPKLNTVEWKTYFKGGVHGVYNHSNNTVEWKTSFNSGIGGVYNPLTGEVEWKTSFNGGVVGYFDHESQTIKWIDKWHHGLALIIWDTKLNTYLTTSSCGWYGDN